jgi:hypothetical protein
MLSNFLVTNRLRPDESQTRRGRVDPGVEAVRRRDLDGEALRVACGVRAAVGLFWKKVFKCITVAHSLFSINIVSN